MQIIHWIIFMLLYKKPRNWGRYDDNDLYLMWDLLSNNDVNWVKFIMDRMIHCRDNSKRPLFFSSFVKLIIEVNGIASKEEDLIEAPKILNYYGFYKMRYYKDNDGD